MTGKTLWAWALVALSAAVSGCGGSDEGAGAGGLYYTPLPPTVDPTETDGDQYEPVGTNPFVVAAHDPQSTFAADVDTASYDIFRRDVNLGVRPQADSVRLEDYVNYFAYDYPPPAEDAVEPFRISLAAAPSVLDRDTLLLRVGIQGKTLPPEQKKPANLVFLVDVSGSMQMPDRLPLAQDVLAQTIGILDPTDTISIVTYAGSTSVRLGPTPAANASTIQGAIDGLSAGGSTAGGAGLTLAYQQAELGFIEGGINHVILCTDGDFNVGPSSTEELLNMIVEKRKTGVTLTALGFGYGNLNDAMLEAVSNAGNGIYGMIADTNQATRYVNERMLSTLVHIAKDVKLQVEFNPALVYAYRLLGYENRALADDEFRDDIVDAGEIGAGHRVTAIYELVLTDRQVPTVGNAPALDDGVPYAGQLEVAVEDLVLAKVRYKNVGALETDPAFEVNASLAPSSVPAAYFDLDSDFLWAVAMASFAEIVKGSPYADRTKLPTLETIFRSEIYADDRDRAEFVSLLDRVKPEL